MPISHNGVFYCRTEKYNHLCLLPPPGGGVTLLIRLLEHFAAVRLGDDAGQEVPGQQIGGARRGETEIIQWLPQFIIRLRVIIPMGLQLAQETYY